MLDIHDAPRTEPGGGDPPVPAVSATPDQPGRRATRLGVAAIAALAALLGFFGLGDTSLWLDETLSAIYAELPPDRFLAFMVREAHQMKAYMLLLRGWMVVGESEVALRALSVLSSVAAVVAIHVLASRLYDRRVGLLAALLLATNGFHLRYAREARAYSLVVLLVIAASILFTAMLWQRRGETSPARRWALAGAFAVTSALAAYAHYFAVLVTAAQAASLAVLRPRTLPWRPLLGSALLIAALILPIAVLSLESSEHRGGRWIPPSGLRELYGVLVHLTGYAGGPAVAAYAIAIGVALAEPRRRRLLTRPAASAVVPAEALPPAADGRETRVPGELAADGEALRRWRVALLVCWLVVPIGVVFAISYEKPMMVPRYLIISLPALVLLAAAGLGTIRRPALLAGALAAFFLTALPGLAFTYRQEIEEDWRGVARHVLSTAREGDALLFHIGAGQQAFDWYRRGMGAETAPPATLFPGSSASLEDALDSLPDGYARVWLILSLHSGPADEALTDEILDPRLRTLYPSVQEIEFPRIRVRLYAKRSASSPVSQVVPGVLEQPRRA